VLHARDRWLKPGGAILPDTAHMYVAGFGKGGTSLPFWEDVYGFDMQFVGQEVVHDATQMPIIDVVDRKDVVTNSCLVQSFDLVTMKTEDVDFTSEFHLELPSEKDRSGVGKNNITTPESANIVCCYGLVVWFDTGFTDRFCREQPVLLSTSPHNPKTHWSQTLLTFREPIALTHSLMDFSKKADIEKIGSESLPALALNGRLSIARSSRHRSIDISVEISAIQKDGLKRTWPVQMFDI
jgi:protein arginine N-methyltransferase 3